MKVKGVAIITRTLREGKTFDDYREAWYHTQGFGVPTQMLTVVNLHNPREIISIGIIASEDDFSAAGEIPKKPTTVDGEEVKYSEMEKMIGIAADMFTEAAKERDGLHGN